MLMAWIFGIGSLGIILSTMFFWIILSQQLVNLSWRTVATKVTSGDLSLTLCRRCVGKLVVNKCYKITGEIYCPVCTAIVGTNTIDEGIKYILTACRVVVMFFGVILLMSAATIFGFI